MKFEYRLQVKDFQEANQAHARKGLWLYYLFIFAIMSLFSIIPLLQSGNISGQEILARVALHNLILISILIIIINVIRFFLIKRGWHNQQHLKNVISVEVLEDGLQIITTLSEAKIKWTLYTQWRETPHLFMIYQSNSYFNLVPKRAFNNEQEINAFREILNTRVKYIA